MSLKHKLKIVKIVIFKHGVSYLINKGSIKGNGTFEIEFKIDEMNDILKSLFALDTSEKGYISSISYDAALDTSQLLRSIMLDIPDQNSFSSLITQIKGARIKLKSGSSEELEGTIMGLETIDKIVDNRTVAEKLIVILNTNNEVEKIPFADIKGFKILNENLNKDLQFFLDTSIAGKKKDSKKIVINCESGGDDESDRDIFVSYLREAPIWKTSYRIIMTKSQAEAKECLLAGYALIENTTNDDWEEIELTLVAGMPVSFIYDFYRPIYIERPKISPPKVSTARPTDIEEGLKSEEFKEIAMEAEAATRAPPAPKRAKMKKADTSSFGRYLGAMAVDEDAFDKLTTSTKVKTKDLGELFEYNISNPVSIKRKSSALVPILTEKMTAKKILLYNKNEHDKNPNACMEITNNTDLTLERGPVTIVYDDNLAGEAIIPFLNKGDTRILNYAIEQAVVINREEESENLSTHRISFSSGYSYEYYFTNLTTEYKIKNKTTETKELYLDHPKSSGYKFIEKPMEPEETANYWRFKITLKPNDAIKFKLKEQLETYTSYYIWNWTKEQIRNKIANYIKRQFIDATLEKLLNEIAELIGKKEDLASERDKLEEERNRMTDAQSRIRDNIAVLGNSRQEMTLKEKYVTKLSEQENAFESIKSRIDKLDKEIKELNILIDEKIKNLKI